MTETKSCISCKIEKPLVDFYPRKGSHDGFRNDCKACRQASSRLNHVLNRVERNRKNLERHKQAVAKDPDFYRKRRALKSEYLKKKDAESYARHREERKQKVKEWARLNRGKSNAIKKAYKAAKLKACPEWVRSNKELREMMDSIYEEAASLTSKTGISHHVDHIVPLRGELVSGLHVPWNLQILTGSENCSKSNKLQEAEVTQWPMQLSR